MRFKFVAGKRSGRVDSILIAATAVAASVSSAWGQATSLPSFNASNVYNITVANSSINGGVPASTSSSNNATAINAYISYVSSLSGGGTVVIPSGTFDSATITMKSNVNLQSGKRRSPFRQHNRHHSQQHLHPIKRLHQQYGDQRQRHHQWGRDHNGRQQ